MCRKAVGGAAFRGTELSEKFTQIWRQSPGIKKIKLQRFCKKNHVSQLLFDSMNIMGTQFTYYTSTIALLNFLIPFPNALIVLSKTCQQSKARKLTIRALFPSIHTKHLKAHCKTLVSFYLVNFFFSFFV